MNFQINEQYVAEYLALREVGASHEEALAQVAQTNEVELEAIAE